MKFLITENKLEQIVFKYLDNLNFIKIETRDRVYLVNHEGDRLSQIRYDKTDGRCFIFYNLVEKIHRFFSIEMSNSERLIAKWVENTLQKQISFIKSTVLLTRIPRSQTGVDIQSAVQ